MEVDTKYNGQCTILMAARDQLAAAFIISDECRNAIDKLCLNTILSGFGTVYSQ